MVISSQSKLDQEITSSQVPDPEVLPDLGGPYLIIRPVEIKNTIKTQSGFELIMPDSIKDDIKYLCNVGRVLALGPYAYKSDELKHGEWFTNGNPKVGDYVVYGRFAGQNFRYKGVNLKHIKDTDIKMRVDDPAYLDTFANIEKA